MSIVNLRNKEDLVSIYKGKLLICEKYEILPFETTDRFEGVMKNEKKSDKDKYCMISLTCGILKKTNSEEQKLE